MAGFGFLVALVLAWPTMGGSLLVWGFLVWMNVGKNRRLNDLRDSRRIPHTGTHAPRQEVIARGIAATLENLSQLPDHQASSLYHELDVTIHGERIDESIAASYLRSAVRFGVEHLDLLASHMTKVASVARQRTVTQAAQVAGLASILYWCIENAARANRDDFFKVDIAKASRKGATADQKLIG